MSTLDQNIARQLDGVAVDRTFTDSASGKDMNRPQYLWCAIVCPGVTVRP